MSKGPGQLQRDIIAVLGSMPSQAQVKKFKGSSIFSDSGDVDWMTWLDASAVAKNVIPRKKWPMIRHSALGRIVPDGPSAADQSAVRRALRSLEDRGLIEVRREPGRNLIRLEQRARGQARQLAAGASKRLTAEQKR